MLTLTRAASVAVAILAATLVATPATVQAESYDPVGSIYAAADNHGVSAPRLLRIAHCESRYTPSSRGDGRRSHGLFQLNDLPTGLYWHFLHVGYDDPYDAEQAADYTARVLAGHFLPGGPYPAPLHPFGIVSIDRWSCK